jgi:hypothetical protein
LNIFVSEILNWWRLNLAAQKVHLIRARAAWGFFLFWSRPNSGAQSARAFVPSRGVRKEKLELFFRRDSHIQPTPSPRRFDPRLAPPPLSHRRSDARRNFFRPAERQ